MVTLDRLVMKHLAKLKKQYSATGISQDSVCKNPIEQFGLWFEQAVDAEIAEPNGFCLSTISETAKPSQRTVLMKSYDDEGLVFYTNHHSRKGRQLAQNNHVSALFPWYELHRQISIEGCVSRISDSLSVEYFNSRPRTSQIGAYASHQSEIITSRQILEQQQQAMTDRFGNQKIPLPQFWGGYRITPIRFEFWQGRAHRLHDRIRYTKKNEHWEIVRLSP